MSAEPDLDRVAATLRAPRAAGIAGIVFSILFAVAIGLFRTAIPAHPADTGGWLTSETQRARVELAIALLPFAGIAFLWFIGVIRDHIGDREDRFFATVFLGSGLLFVAMMFTSGAVMAALVAMVDDGVVPLDVWRFGRRVVFTIMNAYALRTAAVFTIATTTLARRLGVLPRWLQLFGYLSAVALLLLSTTVPWVVMAFPIWVLLVSLQILTTGTRGFAAGQPGTPTSA